MIRIEEAFEHAAGCSEPRAMFERFVRFDINCGGGHGTRGVLLREASQLVSVRERDEAEEFRRLDAIKDGVAQLKRRHIDQAVTLRQTQEKLKRALERLENR